MPLKRIISRPFPLAGDIICSVIFIHTRKLHRNNLIILTRKPHHVSRPGVRQSLQHDGKCAIQLSQSSISTYNGDQDRRSRHRWTSSHLCALLSAWLQVKVIQRLCRKKRRDKYGLAFTLRDLNLYEVFQSHGWTYYLLRE